MITTLEIANIGFPTEPPDVCPLQAILYIPDPALWPGPYHCMVGTRAGHFEDGGIRQLDTPFGGKPGVIGLAERGFLCLAFQVRLLPGGQPPGPDGQVTSGLWPMQQRDMKIGIRYMRPGAEIESVHSFAVTGFVGTLGGSGSAHHAAWMAIEGTEGDDLADAAISMSGVSDYSDREMLPGGNGGGDSLPFQQKTAVYADEDINDLAALLAKSPIALPGLAAAKPMRWTNGTNENQPLSQLTRMRDKMAELGNTDFAYRILDGAGSTNHAFGEWPYIFEETIPWLEAVAADFGGGGGGGPPPPISGRERVTVAIGGLSPGVTYNFVGAAINTVSGLSGPPVPFEFISDRADTGGGLGKDGPVGVYALVDAVEGVIVGDIAARDWLGFSYVDGGILPTSWKAINGAGRTSFDWSQTDAFLAACLDNSKFGGLSINMGIKDPAWLYTGGHAVTSFFENGPNSGTIPLPWDPNYLPTVKKFIVELATRYDAHPELSYVIVGGMGQLLDTLLVQQPADYTALNALAVAAGYPDLITAWAETSTAILDTWSKGFRNTKVFLAINTPVPTANGGLTGIDEFVRAASSAYRSRIGFMTLLLDGSTAASGSLSLNSIIRDSQNPRAYRFLYPSSDPNCDPTQGGAYDAELGLTNAAEAGIALGVQMEEFYEEDILTVTDNYPTHFADFQTALTANLVA